VGGGRGGGLWPVWRYIIGWKWRGRGGGGVARLAEPGNLG
jgi:hypothetical protein